MIGVLLSCFNLSTCTCRGGLDSSMTVLKSMPCWVKHEDVGNHHTVHARAGKDGSVRAWLPGRELAQIEATPTSIGTCLKAQYHTCCTCHTCCDLGHKAVFDVSIDHALEQ
jgi:hypothetical protein